MKKKHPLYTLCLAILLILNIPIFYLLIHINSPIATKLPSKLIFTYTYQTLFIALTVLAGTVILGTSLAWFISVYEFRSRKFFKVAFALPLAIPPYIAAHAYADFFYHYGLLKKISSFFGMNLYLDIFNIYGAIFIYIITLYPYIYLICLSYFQYNCTNYLQNARLLGGGFWRMYLKIGLPLARPSIVSGGTLVLMELLSDFGVVDYFGVAVLSSSIYKLWHNYGDFYGAIRLSAYLLGIILLIILLEQYSRRRLRFYQTTTRAKDFLRICLARPKSNLLIFLLSLILLIVFLLPLLQLFYHATFVWQSVFSTPIVRIFFATIFYTAIAAFLTVSLALLLVNFASRQTGIKASIFTQMATMGYSIPGVILGLAVLFTLFDLDHLLVPFYQFFFSSKRTLIISTSIFALFFAYIVRFLAVGYNHLLANYKKINPTYLQASSTLGYSALKTFCSVEWPLISHAYWSAFALLILEILKELPITLMLKPFSLETLTGRVFLYVHNEQIAHAAIPSLMIIFLGVSAIVFALSFKEKKYV